MWGVAAIVGILASSRRPYPTVDSEPTATYTEQTEEEFLAKRKASRARRSPTSRR